MCEIQCLLQGNSPFGTNLSRGVLKSDKEIQTDAFSELIRKRGMYQIHTLKCFQIIKKNMQKGKFMENKNVRKDVEKNGRVHVHICIFI